MNREHFGCVNNTIRLRSGIYFDLAKPSASDIQIEDIAGSLSKICRFGGQIDKFYSVAEHSVRCAMIAESDGIAAKGIMAVLLHDAAEAFIGDMVKPLKVMIPEYSVIEKNVEIAIGNRFGVNFEQWKEKIQEIDMALLIAEKNVLFSKDDTEWTGESLVRRLELHFTCYEHYLAENYFLKAFHRIDALPF